MNPNVSPRSPQHHAPACYIQQLGDPFQQGIAAAFRQPALQQLSGHRDMLLEWVVELLGFAASGAPPFCTQLPPQV